MSQHNPIYQATIQRCIAEQEEARAVYQSAQRCMKEGFPDTAVKEQNVAASHYAQAWMRLARLIGVE